jgi:hypothetical protein
VSIVLVSNVLERQFTLVAEIHEVEVQTFATPRLPVPDKSSVAKLIPINVTEKPPELGPFTLITFVSTGASKVSAESAVFETEEIVTCVSTDLP